MAAKSKKPEERTPKPHARLGIRNVAGEPVIVDDGGSLRVRQRISGAQLSGLSDPNGQPPFSDFLNDPTVSGWVLAVHAVTATGPFSASLALLSGDSVVITAVNTAPAKTTTVTLNLTPNGHQLVSSRKMNAHNHGGGGQEVGYHHPNSGHITKVEHTRGSTIAVLSEVMGASLTSVWLQRYQ